MKSKAIILAAVAVFASSAAHAQLSQSNGCAPNAQNCTGSNQSSGDVSTTTNNGDTHSTSSQLGNSTASNVSGNSVGFDNRTQTTQNANNTTTGTISGGNTSSGATGGAATGNLSSNDNRASVGNTSSNSGGNALSTGDSRASVGNTSASGGAGGAGGTASQGQGQQQGQTASVRGGNSTSGATARTGDSRSLSAATGGNQRQNATGGAASSAGGTASANGAGQRTAVDAGSGNGQSTTIGGSSYSDNSRTIFIPPVVPATPPSVVGVGQVIQTTLACGPLQTVVKEPVIGTYFGMFSNEQIEQGHTDFLAPVLDSLGHQVSYREETMSNGDIRLFGTQPVIYATVVSIAGARNVAIGGGGGSGSWGQAGGGASASMTQLVTNVQLHECEIGTLHKPEIFVPPPLPELPATPVPMVKKHRIVARKAKPCIAPK